MSKFEYTGEYRRPKVGEYFTIVNTTTPQLMMSGWDDPEKWPESGDSTGWRRPIMRKVEPLVIKMEKCYRWDAHGSCARVLASGLVYHLSTRFPKDVKLFAELFDNGREIEYTESTGEKDE